MSRSNSPSVKRSNSYRIALRKSGISKEYIDEFERMQLELAQQNAEEIISSITAEIQQSTNNKQSIELSDNLAPKPKSFRRNFSNKKRDTTTTAAVMVSNKENSPEQLGAKSLGDNDDKVDEEGGIKITNQVVANLNNVLVHRNNPDETGGNLMNNIAMNATGNDDAIRNNTTKAVINNNQDNCSNNNNLQDNLNIKTTAEKKKKATNNDDDAEQNHGEKSGCVHLLCLMFCCNYCCGSLRRSQ